jgi:hypothetical protein
VNYTFYRLTGGFSTGGFSTLFCVFDTNFVLQVTYIYSIHTYCTYTREHSPKKSHWTFINIQYIWQNAALINFVCYHSVNMDLQEKSFPCHCVFSVQCCKQYILLRYLESMHHIVNKLYCISFLYLGSLKRQYHEIFDLWFFS